MKNREIRRQIKEQALQEIPDVYSRIDLKNIHIEAKEELQVIKQRPNILKLALVSMGVLLAIFFGFQILNTSQTFPLESAEELLGFQVVSASALLDFDQTDINENTSNSDLIQLSQSQANEMDDYLIDFEPYIQFAELIVNKEKDVTIKKTESDINQYVYKITYQSYNLMDQTIEYQIYYNTLTDDSTEGIIKQGTRSLDFIKNNESLRLYKDDTHYIEVKVNSGNKQSFTYKMMKNNQSLFETDIELFKESKGFGVNIHVRKENVTYSLMMNRNNHKQFEVEYEVDDYHKNKHYQGKFNVDIEEETGMPGNHHYKFSFDDESHTTHPRCRGNSQHC